MAPAFGSQKPVSRPKYLVQKDASVSFQHIFYNKCWDKNSILTWNREMARQNRRTEVAWRKYLFKKIYLWGLLVYFKTNIQISRLVYWRAWPVCWPRGRHQTPKLCRRTGMGASPLCSHARISSENRVHCRCADHACPKSLSEKYDHHRFCMRGATKSKFIFSSAAGKKMDRGVKIEF